MITQTQYHTGFAYGVIISIHEMESDGWAVRQIIPTQKDQRITNANINVPEEEVVTSWLVVYEREPPLSDLDLEREAQFQAVQDSTDHLTKAYRDSITDLANRDTECPNATHCPFVDYSPHKISDHPLLKSGETIDVETSYRLEQADEAVRIKREEEIGDMGGGG